METRKIDVELLKAQFPNPRPSDPTQTCGYCVGGALLAFLDDISAAEADEGHKPNWRVSYFPLTDEVADILRKLNPALPQTLSTRYAHFITALNDRKRFNFSWSTLKEALEWKAGDNTSKFRAENAQHLLKTHDNT